MSSVLRLGVYRERIEKYGGGGAAAAAKSNGSNGHAANGNGGVKCEELLSLAYNSNTERGTDKFSLVCTGHSLGGGKEPP